MLVLESNFPGGQAGSSSKIENYLGFPTGISGQALAGRAYTQAQKFGAAGHGRARRDEARLRRSGRTRSRWTTATPVPARAVIIATGAQYRKLPLENLSRFEGAGVYYAASFMEAQLCGGEEVIVVGGGNSAGQAAVFLAQTAARVHMLVRSSGLARHHVALPDPPHRGEPEDHAAHRTPRSWRSSGDDHLERVRWRNRRTGEDEDARRSDTSS